MLKKMILLIFGAVATCYCFAQNDTPYSYLRVYFERASAAGRQFLKLNAEAGNKYALELYSLKTVKIKEPEWRDDAVYYAEANKKVSDSLIFMKGNNAFRTATEGLNFLAERNWELFLVESNTSIDNYNRTTKGSYAIPEWISNPVYIFRKKAL